MTSVTQRVLGPRGTLVLALAALAVQAGCTEEACRSEPPGVQLVLGIDPALGAAATALELEVVAGDQGWRQRLELSGELADGASELGVVLSPAPTAAYALSVRVTALGANAQAIATAEASAPGTLDACTRLELALRAGGPATDAGVDAGALDGAVADADAGTSPDADTGTTPGADADTGVALDADAGVSPDADAGVAMDADAGVSPDADAGVGLDADAQPLDMGLGPDGGDAAVSPDVPVTPVDAGLVPFTVPPLNVDPTTLTATTALRVSCAVVLDTQRLRFDRSCGGPLPAVVLRTQAAGAPELAVVAVSRLEVTNFGNIEVRGPRAAVFVVFGEAQIDGVIDVSANTAAAGPGAGAGALCGMGASGGSGGVERGGGAGGALATSGGAGGDGGDESTGAGRSIAWSDLDLEPLRGGCPGGNGGTNSASSVGLGGGGGGALQISASVQVRVGAGGALYAGGGAGSGASVRRGGGGGGGSGGGILLDAPTVILTGTIRANGAGGGAGGADRNVAGSARPGETGRDDAPDGGSDTERQGGQGGDGSGFFRPDGEDADDGAESGQGAGGGGGGGGAGIVRVRRGMGVCGGQILPPASGC